MSFKEDVKPLSYSSIDVITDQRKVILVTSTLKSKLTSNKCEKNAIYPDTSKILYLNFAEPIFAIKFHPKSHCKYEDTFI